MPIPIALKSCAEQLGYPNSGQMGKLLSLMFDTEEKNYRLYPGMIELRDAAVLSQYAAGEMICLWDEMIHNNLPGIVPRLEEMGVTH